MMPAPNLFIDGGILTAARYVEEVLLQHAHFVGGDFLIMPLRILQDV